MPKLLLDFTGVELKGDYEPVPAGVYDAVIDASRIELRNSQAGNDVVSVPFVIQAPAEYAGRVVYDNYVLTDKALWKLGQLLAVVGIVSEDNLGRITLDTDLLHNKPVRIQVGIDTYNDKPRNKVQRVAAPPQEVVVTKGKTKKSVNF